MIVISFCLVFSAADIEFDFNSFYNAYTVILQAIPVLEGQHLTLVGV